VKGPGDSFVRNWELSSGMILALNGEGPWGCRICSDRKRVHASEEVKIKNDIQMKIEIGFCHPQSQEQAGAAWNGEVWSGCWDSQISRPDWIGLNGGPEFSPDAVRYPKASCVQHVFLSSKSRQLVWKWRCSGAACLHRSGSCASRVRFGRPTLWRHDAIFSQISVNPATGPYLISSAAAAAVQSSSAANTSLSVQQHSVANCEPRGRGWLQSCPAAGCWCSSLALRG